MEDKHRSKFEALLNRHHYNGTGQNEGPTFPLCRLPRAPYFPLYHAPSFTLILSPSLRITPQATPLKTIFIKRNSLLSFAWPRS
jgi:hypothetical protein